MRTDVQRDGKEMCDAHDLPEGVTITRLVSHADARGAHMELFREEWDTQVAPVQWNIVHSHANVLRGVHVHVVHSDYFMLAEGRVTMGLRDLRPGSPTEGKAALLEVRGDQHVGITIPSGVAHGFLLHEPSVYLYGVTAYWNRADELGCFWADPALEIPWPDVNVTLSPRDAALPPLSALLDRIPPWRATGASALQSA